MSGLTIFEGRPQALGTLNAALAAPGYPVLTLDLWLLPKRGPLRDWFDNPQGTWCIGALFEVSRPLWKSPPSKQGPLNTHPAWPLNPSSPFSKRGPARSECDFPHAGSRLRPVPRTALHHPAEERAPAVALASPSLAMRRGRAYHARDDAGRAARPACEAGPRTERVSGAVCEAKPERAPAVALARAGLATLATMRVAEHALRAQRGPARSESLVPYARPSPKGRRP